MCIAYEVHHQYTAPETAAYFRHKITELDRLSGEFHRADGMVELWRATRTGIADSASKWNASLNGEVLSPERIAETTQRTMDEFANERKKLDAPLAEINSMSFDTASLQGLQAKLSQDLLTADQIADARIQFIKLLQTDLGKAAELIPTIMSNREESRRILESAAREAVVDSVLERARSEYNDTLAEARAQEQMAKNRSRAAVAAWTYIGAFIGAFGSWKIRQFRNGRKARAPIAEKAPTDVVTRKP
jgi:hypothetical protein